MASRPPDGSGCASKKRHAPATRPSASLANSMQKTLATAVVPKDRLPASLSLHDDSRDCPLFGDSMPTRMAPAKSGGELRRAPEAKHGRTHDVRNKENRRGNEMRILRSDRRTLYQLAHTKGPRNDWNQAKSKQAGRMKFLGSRRDVLLGKFIVRRKESGRCDSAPLPPAPLRREAPRRRTSCACRWRRRPAQHS